MQRLLPFIAFMLCSTVSATVTVVISPSISQTVGWDPMATVTYTATVYRNGVASYDPIQIWYTNQTTMSSGSNYGTGSVPLAVPRSEAGIIQINAASAYTYAAPVELTVVKVSVSASPTTACVTEVVQCTATGAPSGGSFSWSAPDGSPNAKGDFSTFSTEYSTVGDKTITVTYSMNGVAVSAAVTIKVHQISVRFDKPAICADGTSQVQATADPSDLPVTWSLFGATGGATIDSNGLITAGTNDTKLIVRATLSSDSYCLGEATIDQVKVYAVYLNPTAICADGTSKSQASAIIGPTGRSITWSIQNDALGCKIDSTTGEITAGTKGGTITVRAADSVLYDCYSEGKLDVVKIGPVTVAPVGVCADSPKSATATVAITPSRAVTWSIVGPALGCTIDSSGKITTGTTAGTLTVRATDAGISGCYADGTLMLYTVVSATLPAPDGTANNRTTVGVCEDVTFTASAPATSWTVSPAGTGTFSSLAGTTTVFSAPDVASTCTITATFPGSVTCSITLNVIPPSGVSMVRFTDRPYIKGFAGSGFFARVTIEPTSVLFSNIQTQEQTAVAVTTGFYSKIWSGLVHPLGVWIPVDGANGGIIDKIGTSSPGLDPKKYNFETGTFLWPIPWRYRGAGRAASYQFTIANHSQIMLGKSGTEITSKAGATRTRVP